MEEKEKERVEVVVKEKVMLKMEKKVMKRLSSMMMISPKMKYSLKQETGSI